MTEEAAAGEGAEVRHRVVDRRGGPKFMKTASLTCPAQAVFVAAGGAAVGPNLAADVGTSGGGTTGGRVRVRGSGRKHAGVQSGAWCLSAGGD